MTTFTTIPNSSLEPGKPIRSIDGLALRDNPLAMFEGDSSAPRLVGKAIKRLQEMPVLTVSASDSFSIESGSNPQFLNSQTSNTNNPPTVVAQRYTIQNYTGSARFKLSHANVGGSISYLSIYKNNVLVQAYSTSSTSLIQRTNDISIVPNDVIEWRHSTNASIDLSVVSSPLATSSNGYTTRQVFISSTDNLNP